MGRVAAAGGGVAKCVNPGGRVARAVRIACERLRTRSGIHDPSSVVPERTNPIGRVVVADGIVEERSIPDSYCGCLQC